MAAMFGGIAFATGNRPALAQICNDDRIVGADNLGPHERVAIIPNLARELTVERIGDLVVVGLACRAMHRQGFLAKVRHLHRQALAGIGIESVRLMDRVDAPQIHRRCCLRQLAVLAVGLHAQLVGRRLNVDGMFRAVVVGPGFKGNEVAVLPGFIGGMFVAVRLDEHHLHGNVCLDLYRGRIVLMFDVDRVRADFVAPADNIENLMDLGRGGGIVGTRWHDWQEEKC